MPTKPAPYFLDNTTILYLMPFRKRLIKWKNTKTILSFFQFFLNKFSQKFHINIADIDIGIAGTG